MTGQLSFDDCTPDWPTPEPRPRRRSAGTRYYVDPYNDLWDQTRRPGARRANRIVTIPIAGEYL